MKSRTDVIISKMLITVHVTLKRSMPHINVYHHICFSRAWGIPVRLSSKYGCTNTKKLWQKNFYHKKAAMIRAPMQIIKEPESVKFRSSKPMLKRYDDWFYAFFGLVDTRMWLTGQKWLEQGFKIIRKKVSRIFKNTWGLIGKEIIAFK